MVTHSTDCSIPAEDKVTNSTAEDDREDDITADCRFKARFSDDF